MITLVHRNTWGFKDNFEGYVFLKDEMPFAQLHLYRKYNTFFWLGSSSAERIASCLSSSVEEISQQFGMPFSSLNSGNLRLVTSNRVADLPFAIHREEQTLPSMVVTEAEVSFERFLLSVPSSTFVRFNVDSSQNFPLILWGDIGEKESSEIGFSSLTDLPPSVMSLLLSTCKTELTKDDLDEISGQVSKRTPVFA